MPINQTLLIGLRGRSGSGSTKMVALEKNEILQIINELADLNSEIYEICKLKANHYYKSDCEAHTELTLAFFKALSIQSFTTLRTKLDSELHKS